MSDNDYYTERAASYDDEPSRNAIRYAEELSVNLRAATDSVPMTRESILLDVGCGTGRGIVEIIETGVSFPGTAIGIDKSQAMLLRARSKLAYSPLAVALVQADAHKLPLRDGVVSLALALKVIQYLRLGEFAAEIARVLMPNGVMFLTTVVVHADDQDNWRNIVGRKHSNTYPSYFFRQEAIHMALQERGLVAVTSKTIGVRRYFADLVSEKSQYWSDSVTAAVVRDFASAPKSLKSLYEVDDAAFTQHYLFGLYKRVGR